MNKDTYDRLAADYTLLQQEKFNVYEEWIYGYITTGEAIVTQRMIEEQMQDIRDLLLAELSMDEPS